MYVFELGVIDMDRNGKGMFLSNCNMTHYAFLSQTLDGLLGGLHMS